MASLLRHVQRRPATCAVVATGSIGCAWQVIRQFKSAPPPVSHPLGSLAGRRAIVVGGTSGIGHGIALSLAKAGCSVTIAGRSEARGSSVVRELETVAAASAAQRGRPSFTFEALDCFSLPACRDFASRHAASRGSLDFLVLTQGMATLQAHTPTPATHGGLDEKLTLHYWSRVLLAKQLAPVLERSADGRVLFILSAGVHGPYAKYAEDPELSRGGYSIKAAADAAGFYTDIAVEQLSTEHPSVTFLHAVPGFVATSWGTEMPLAVRMAVRVMQVFGRSKEEAGELMSKGLVCDRYRGGGWYLLDQYGEPSAAVTALHEAAKAKVWAHTQRVVAALGSADSARE